MYKKEIGAFLSGIARHNIASSQRYKRAMPTNIFSTYMQIFKKYMYIYHHCSFCYHFPQNMIEFCPHFQILRTSKEGIQSFPIHTTTNFHFQYFIMLTSTQYCCYHIYYTINYVIKRNCSNQICIGYE